jgi:hypothetical protein
MPNLRFNSPELRRDGVKSFPQFFPARSRMATTFQRTQPHNTRVVHS